MPGSTSLSRHTQSSVGGNESLPSACSGSQAVTAFDWEQEAAKKLMGTQEQNNGSSDGMSGLSSSAVTGVPEIVLENPTD